MFLDEFSKTRTEDFAKITQDIRMFMAGVG